MKPQAASSEGALRVLFLAAEAEPLIKVGGLGDVAGSLPKALNHLNPASIQGRRLDVRVVLPRHPGIRKKYGDKLERIATVNVPHGPGVVPATIDRIILADTPYYLVSGEPVPEEGPVYSLDAGEDGRKFTFTSLAALELARYLDWRPDILHANDWHTAMAVYALTSLYAEDPFFEKTRSVLTVHNLPFLGVGAESALEEFGLPASLEDRLPDWARGMPLPLGLLSADRIVAVSPQYAREILTPEYGSGLSDFLRTRQNVITGILNGIDLPSWDPAKDEAIPSSFSIDHIERRRANKNALLEEFHLSPAEDVPLLIFIGRMDPQKGFDLVINGLKQLTHEPWQAIILGTGVPQLEQEAHDLEAQFPDRVRSVLRFDGQLARRMYAGGDVILMPSWYEPCGLAQIIAMRYGCIPFAHHTGGLVNTIQNQFNRADGTGFLFTEHSAESFRAALEKVISMYQKDPTGWQALQKRAMAQNYSWERSALDYAQIYLQLTDEVL